MSRQDLPGQDAEWERLLDAARRGSGAARELLMARYRPYLQRVAAEDFPQQLQGRVSPSDVVQDAFVKLQTCMARFEGRSEPQFRMWLRRIVRNELENTRRYHMSQRREVARDCSAKGLAFARVDSTPSQIAMRQEVASALRSFFGEMSSLYQRIIFLRHRKEMSFAEISREVNRTPDAVRMMWWRAVEILRAHFGDQSSSAVDLGDQASI